MSSLQALVVFNLIHWQQSSMVILLLSMAIIPLHNAGFFAKFYIFVSAVEADFLFYMI